MKLVILGLSITSSWGNGHATTFRGLVQGLAARGHKILFLERNLPWYAENRDMPTPPGCRTEIYSSLGELRERFGKDVRTADAVLVGSYVPEGIAVGEWVQGARQGLCAYYDLDTPVTLTKLAQGECDYLSPALIAGYDLFLSFSGGPTLTMLEQTCGSPCARPLYCAVDPELYFPEAAPPEWDLGYMGTYSDDRQPPLESLALEPARRWPEGRFVVAGPQYPEEIVWPANVTRMMHLAPASHRGFYSRQRWTLNITRADMIVRGWSPSVRLFEAAACAVPVLSDRWAGLSEFFEPGREIVLTGSAEDTLRAIREMQDDERREIGQRARARVLTAHTAAHRAAELERYFGEL